MALEHPNITFLLFSYNLEQPNITFLLFSYNLQQPNITFLGSHFFINHWNTLILRFCYFHTIWNSLISLKLSIFFSLSRSAWMNLSHEEDMRSLSEASAKLFITRNCSGYSKKDILSWFFSFCVLMVVFLQILTSNYSSVQFGIKSARVYIFSECIFPMTTFLVAYHITDQK